MEKTGTFKPGQQSDSVSCGLFAMNAIRHDIFKVPLLGQKGVQAERVMWFNTLCQTAYEVVWSHSMRLHDNLTKLRGRKI